MNNELLKQMLLISQEMAETHDIDKLLTLAMEKTAEIVGAELCYLVLVESNGNLNFRAWSIKINDDQFDIDDALSRSIFDKVVNSSQPTVIMDALTDGRFSLKSSVIHLQIRSVMCVPLLVGGKTLGALYVENRSISGAFRQDDLEPLIFFANQAAASIENALIIANLENRIAERTAELEASWHDAVEANKMRTSLLALLAHDMRTPATIVMLSLSNLRNPRFGELNEKQERWIERGLDGIKQMNELVSNIFDLSKVEMNALEINKESVEMIAFLERIYEIGLALPWHEDVQFEKNLPDSLPALNIDPVRIEQVLMNLISNAVKFTKSGSVTLHSEQKGDEIQIGVRDTGEGIPKEALGKIFNRFSQFDGDDTRRTRGAGLGLAICRELVEKHSGRIRVESTPAVGSDFVFILSV